MKCFHGHCPVKLDPAIITLSLFATFVQADSFTTTADQSLSPSSGWNDVVWQPGASAPVAGNSYEVLNGGWLVNPSTAGTQTFPGDSLILDADATLEANGPVGTSLNFPGTDAAAGLILNGGTLLAGDDHTFRISGRILVAADSVIDQVSASRNFTVTAQIDGNGKLTLLNGDIRRPLDIRSTNNLFQGTWSIASGYLRGSGVGSLGSGDIVIYDGARFTVNYDLQTTGKLNLMGSNSVMFLHQNCQFGSVIIGGTTLAPGNYRYSDLMSEFPSNFAPGGSGGITVLPSSAIDADAHTTAVVSDNQATESAGSAGTSGDSTFSTGHLIPVAYLAPDPPSGVIVSTAGFSQITIQWNNASILSGLGLGSYDIYRNGSKIATTTATSYNDTGLNPNTQYCYTIVTIDVLGNDSSPSAPACATTAPRPDRLIPQVPSGLLVMVNSTSQVTLHWNASLDYGGSGLAGYHVYRDGALLTSTASNSYTDSGLAPGTQYCYAVAAYDNAGNMSAASALACATTSALPPAAPSNLLAAALDSNKVSLAWTDNANNELGFQIERASAPSGPWQTIGMTGANVTSFTDTGLNPATTYYYRVSAFN